MPLATSSILDAIPELEQDIPVDSFAPATSWLPIALSSAAIVLLLILGVILRRKYHTHEGPATPTAEQQALQAIDHMEQDREQLSLRSFSLQLSMILREFLTGETQDPALFETHEEFCNRMDALSAIPADSQRETRRLLEELAELKYAGSGGQDHAAMRAMLDDARSLVSRIAEGQRCARAAAEEQMKLRK